MNQLGPISVVYKIISKIRVNKSKSILASNFSMKKNKGRLGEGRP